MSFAGSAVPENGTRRALSVWVVPVAGLVGLWLWLAFSSGGYSAEQWLPPSLALGLFGLVACLLIAYPRRPGQLSLAVLTLFGCYGVWVALSALWASSVTRVWMESARTFSYVLVFALALVYFTDPAARRAFRYLLMGAASVLLAVCVWRLWSASDVAALFFEKRFTFPVSYPNNAGALFLVSFWPLMWLATSREERAPVRGVALGLATGLLGLAVMTQSRGAIWSLAVATAFMFLLTPTRLRMLFYLVVPTLLMVYAFPNLNRYWVNGPEATGGAVAGRTLLVAALTAVFIGMIVALLERWVNVSRRMKGVFGTVILLGVVAGIVYASVLVTSTAGGPIKWVTQSWREFTGRTNAEWSTEPTSRFTLVSSTGRVAIWRVAWLEFKSAPVLGVGADNFIFENDRLRPEESSKPQQAHSIELQVLGETGIVGGFFAFGGILAILVGVLWPRCAAGWLGARGTWLRRRKSEPPPGSTTACSRWCNPRWGTDPGVYGWEIALLVGAAYWLVHASVDWLWQMAGVTIPALLFVAAAISSVDARAGVLWPRLRRRPRSAKTPDASQTAEVNDTQERQVDIGRQGRVVRRQRREDGRLQPPGLLSHVYRALVVTLSLAVLVGAGLPYLSLLFQHSALALADVDAYRAVKRAESVRWLQPADPGPYLTAASIYQRSANAALGSDRADRSGAVLDDLALCMASYEQATRNEPADWSLRYGAGVAGLNLLIAEEEVGGVAPDVDYGSLITTIPGLADWSALSSATGEAAAPGQAEESLAKDETTRASAAYYRGLSQRDIGRVILNFLEAAHYRNPLATQVDAAIQALDTITSP